MTAAGVRQSERYCAECGCNFYEMAQPSPGYWRKKCAECGSCGPFMAAQSRPCPQCAGAPGEVQAECPVCGGYGRIPDAASDVRGSATSSDVWRDVWRITLIQLATRPAIGWRNVRFLLGMKIGGFDEATRR